MGSRIMKATKKTKDVGTNVGTDEDAPSPSKGIWSDPVARSAKPALEQQLEKDGYVLRDEIGAGTFGTVFKIQRCSRSRLRRHSARRLSADQGTPGQDGDNCDAGQSDEDPMPPRWKTKKRLAMKLVHTRTKETEIPWTKEKTELGWMRNEIDFLSQVKHSHIVRFYHSCETPDWLFLIEEWVPDGDLYGLFSSNDVAFTLCQIRLFFRQLVRAVGYLHRMNIVHRDIKLENVLLNRKKNSIKLCDFGFATWDHDQLPVKLSVGTATYTSPEVITQDKQRLRPAEIWALGIVLYMMLFRDYPFWHESRYVLFQRIESEEPDYTHGNEDMVNKLLNHQRIHERMRERMHERTHERMRGAPGIQQNESAELEQRLALESSGGHCDNIPGETSPDKGSDLSSSGSHCSIEPNSVVLFCSSHSGSDVDDLTTKTFENGVDLIKRILVKTPDSRIGMDQMLLHPFIST